MVTMEVIIDGKKYVEDALKDMVKRGYLKHTKKGYVDSDRVTAMLKEGKTRKQIAKILDKEEAGEQ